MLFVLIGCFLLCLKLFQVTPFAHISWWWIVLPLLFAVLWFEVIEPMFGLDVAREKRQYERMSKRFLKPIRSARSKGKNTPLR
ncbi:MAG: TIGR04438 family Trp-rich protein [Burkholderiaceae bacterium]|jgi:small Trp-rich protein